MQPLVGHHCGSNACYICYSVMGIMFLWRSFTRWSLCNKITLDKCGDIKHLPAFVSCLYTMYLIIVCLASTYKRKIHSYNYSSQLSSYTTLFYRICVVVCVYLILQYFSDVPVGCMQGHMTDLVTRDFVNQLWKVFHQNVFFNSISFILQPFANLWWFFSENPPSNSWLAY